MVTATTTRNNVKQHAEQISHILRSRSLPALAFGLILVTTPVVLWSPLRRTTTTASEGATSSAVEVGGSLSSNGIFDFPTAEIIPLPNNNAMKGRYSSSEIKTIALIGERNSGTTWMLRELRRCYNQSFTVLNHLTRHKHYFQYDDGGLRVNHNRTLVVAEFRDPYQWLLAMVEKPRRTTSHRRMDWHDFVTTPWTTPRAPTDQKYANMTGPVCQEHFEYHEVVSCEKYPNPDEYMVYKTSRKREQTFPIYEMKRDGSGLPYDSVVDMRADKIRNHVLEVKGFTSFVEDVVVVRYEDLLAQGTGPFLNQVSTITGVEPHCQATPPQPKRPGRPMPEGFKEWMDKHVDWEAEALIGYSKN